MTLIEALRFQARSCEILGSPFMARLMDLLAERLRPGTRVADRLFDWPGDPSPRVDAVPLRLAGALHALRLQGKALHEVYPPNDVDDDTLWSAVSSALDDHAEHVLTWMANAPQTNEVRRASVILPGLAALNARFQRPVALFELGTSGGLNLRADRFRLEIPGGGLGPKDAEVKLAPDWTGTLPLPADLPDVTHRAGVDLNPVDPAVAEGRLRLLAYIWPDQPERIARTEAAIKEAARTPADISKGDAGAWLEAALEHAVPGTLRLVFHTVAWQYFPEETRNCAQAAMARAAAQATPETPFAHLSMEGDGGRGAAVRLTAWPGAEVMLEGRADFHGRWVDWQSNG